MSRFTRATFTLAIVTLACLSPGCGSKENQVIQPAQNYQLSEQEKQNLQTQNKEINEGKSDFQGN